MNREPTVPFFGNISVLGFKVEIGYKFLYCVN